MFSDKREGLFGRSYIPFELGVFSGFKHGFEFGTGAVAGGDEFAAGEEEPGGDGLGGG